MEKHIMGENGISYTLGGWSVLSRPVSPGGDGVSNREVWNVAKDGFKGASERIVPGVCNYRETE